jgi:hypothetical protein
MKCRYLALAALVFSFTAPLSAQSLYVLPTGNAAVEGNSQINGPMQSGAITYQWVYPASQMSGVPIGSLINGISFRMDGAAGATNAAISFPQWNLQLSTSVNGVGALSGTFANNIGADVVTVRSGALNIPAGAFPFGSSPNAFAPVIPFTTPYTYNGGSILFTLTDNGTANGFSVDGNTQDANGSTVLNNSFNATTGTANFFNYPITEISFTASVPEPATWALLGVTGIASLGWFRWNRRRTTAN